MLMHDPTILEPTSMQTPSRLLIRSLNSNRNGASLVEALAAFAILAGSAMVIFPIHVLTAKTGKWGDVKQYCQNIVRGKLDEYRSGDLIPSFTTAGAGVSPRLSYLSAPTLANSTVDSSGNMSVGGFFYAKYKYNEFFPASCRGVSQADIFDSSKHSKSAYSGITRPELGIRECIGKDTSTNPPLPIQWEDGTPPPKACDSTADLRAQKAIPGFKLYVKMERSTPWTLAPTGGPNAKTTQYDLSCPNHGQYTPAGDLGSTRALYDFNGAGDSIKITVTGVMDVFSENLDQLAGVDDPFRLQCSASTLLHPHPFPARFYLGSGGRLYTIHGRGLNKSSTNFSFTSLYTQGAMQASNILSFAVHPRNMAIYVLRPGSLMRYSNCGGVPLDCSTLSNNTAGISDSGETDWPSVQEWSVPSNISHIGVDFRSGVVYGMSGNHEEFYDISYNGAPLRDCRNDCTVSPPVSADLAPITGTSFPKPPISGSSWPLRLTGFFVVPEGNEAFVSDITSIAWQGETLYYASIYRRADVSLSSPIATLPAAAKSFSK